MPASCTPQYNNCHSDITNLNIKCGASQSTHVGTHLELGIEEIHRTCLLRLVLGLMVLLLLLGAQRLLNIAATSSRH